MTQTITANGTALTTVPRAEIELTECAYLGEVGTGSLTILDDDGMVDIVGLKSLTVDQDAATPARLWSGFVSARRYTRGPQSAGTARQIVVEVADLNDLLNRYIISGTDGKRPYETVADRVSWILDSDYLSSLVVDSGLVSASTSLGMDATDYRGQRPGDVLAACALKSNANYFVYDASGTASLYFDDPNGGTAYTSTLRISNVAADVDSTTTFAPSQDAELDEDPEHLYSDVYAAYAKGVVTATLAATASTYVTRWATTDDTGIKTGVQALAHAQDFLTRSSTPEHVIRCTIRVRAAYANLVRAGQRIQAKFSHFTAEGYGDFTWFRVLRRTIRQPTGTDADYDLELTLSPQEGFVEPPSAFCAALDRTADGDYWPLGYSGSGGLPNPSDGVVQYFRPGLPNPVYPIVGEVGNWHFSNFGVGGPGSIDRSGTGLTGNELIFCVVGSGRALIQTVSASPGITLSVTKGLGNANITAATFSAVATITPGDAVEVTIVSSEASDSDCVNWIVIKQSNSTTGPLGWGWSQMTWTRT